MQLAKEIGVTQKTAWFMLSRLREACSNPDSQDDAAVGKRLTYKTLIGEAVDSYVER